jgi:DNA-binding PadR family transcriptional regulator
MKARRSKPRAEEPPPLKPLAFLLLVSLAAGERHGYALKKDILARTAGKVRPGPATLYRAIGELVDRRWIEESERRPAPELDDARRRYYRVTDEGRRALLAEARRLESLVDAARVAAVGS